MADSEGKRKAKEESLLKSNPEKNELKTKSGQESVAKSNQRNYEPNEGKRIFKNIIALASSFVLLFTAFMSMSNLQSSLNEEGGLGAYSLATIYIGLCISSLFLPTLLIQKFTCKWTLIFSMTGYMVYIGAQFYPTFWTLIPAALYLGFCAAPLWAAQSIYLTKIGEEYGYLTSTSSELILQRFFGLFYLFFHSSQVWGNLIASLLIAYGNNNSDVSNETAEVLDFSVCGGNYCPTVPSDEYELNVNATVSTNKKIPNMEVIYLLSGVFLAFSITAAFITWLFVDSLERYGEKEDEGNSDSSAKQLALATVNHWRKPHQLLLIPATIWIGAQAGFIGADFNLGYVACTMGVEYIGYVMIVLGLADALSSFCFGRLIKFTGRAPVFTFSAILSMTSLVILSIWNPNPDEPLVLFIVAILWGLADGIWLPQMNAMYGSIFQDTKEAAFSNNRFWTAVGFVTAYVNGTLFCMQSKIYICACLITLGLIGYLIVEVRLRIIQRKTMTKPRSINNL